MVNPAEQQREYKACWEIDVTDTSPRQAAQQAWEHMRRPDSIANVFTIYDHHTGAVTRIDLSGTTNRARSKTTRKAHQEAGDRVETSGRALSQ